MKTDPQKIAEQHKFCFICKGVMIWKEGKLSVCSKCGYRNYINPTPCNAVILTDAQGEILLVRRKSQYKNEYWDLPGGFMEFNENAEESMLREIKEELGIKIKGLKYFGSQHDAYTYDGITFPTLGLIYVGRIKDINLTPTDDVSEIKFFLPADLPFERIAFDGIKRALKNFIKSQ